MKVLLLLSSSCMLLSKLSAFKSPASASRLSHCSASSFRLHNQVQTSDTSSPLLAAKLYVLQGVVKKLHKREKYYVGEGAPVEKNHAEAVPSLDKRHGEVEHRNGKCVDHLKAEIRRLKHQQDVDEAMILRLTSETEKFSVKLKTLNAKLNIWNTEIDEANRIISFERRKRAEIDETYDKRIIDFEIANKAECADIRSELKLERENSARYYSDIVKLTKQAENEVLERKEREVIATSAVEASEKRVALLEVKLLSSEKMCSRLQAQIKVQRLLIHGFLEKSN